MLTRLIEFVTSLVVLLFAALPMLVLLSIRRLFGGKVCFLKQAYYLNTSSTLKAKLFNTKHIYLNTLPLYSHVLSGKLRVIGSSLRPIEEVTSGLEIGKPGILSIWLIRRINKIDYEGRDNIDLEYLKNRSIKKDFMILVKSLLALSAKVGANKTPEKIDLLGINFLNCSMSAALELISRTVDMNKKEKFYFMNPDCFNKLFEDEEYRAIMEKSDNVFPDGSGVNMACAMIGKDLRHNVNGTDMLPYLCEMAEKNRYRLFLLGANPGITEKMKKNLEEKYPDLIVCGTNDGYFDRENESDIVIDRINKSQANILLVAFGVPLQEKWIEKNFHELQINAAIGVGGLFDFYSGTMPRAPKWMRELGIEWVFRLMMEPKRMWRRYIIGNPLFLKRVRTWKKEQNKVNN